MIHTSGEVPHPTELLMIADREIDEDTSDGGVQMPDLYARMTHVFPCSECGRLWIFENAMDRGPFPTLGSLIGQGSAESERIRFGKWSGVRRDYGGGGLSAAAPLGETGTSRMVSNPLFN